MSAQQPEKGEIWHTGHGWGPGRRPVGTMLILAAHGDFVMARECSTHGVVNSFVGPEEWNLADFLRHHIRLEFHAMHY